jgi:hypothetical protein
VVAAVILFALFSGAWLVFENFSGRFSDTACRLAQFALYPGWLVDVWTSGSYHGGFGDWRDFAVMVAVSWSTWMIPVLLVWRSLRKDRIRDETTSA